MCVCVCVCVCVCINVCVCVCVCVYECGFRVEGFGEALTDRPSFDGT
jgi:hypothetical protein